MDALTALQSLGLSSETRGPDGEKLLQQAQQVWSMLDDMADKDPQAYQRFIQKQKLEFEEANKPPKPHMCIRTKFQSGDGSTIYINLVSWTKVPKPKTDQDSIPLFAAPVEVIRDKKTGESTSSIAVAVNPDVLADYGIECKNISERNSFVSLTLDYVQHLCKQPVDHNFSILPRSVNFKGDLEKAQIFFKDSLKNAMKKNKKNTEASKDSLLHDMDVPDSVLSRLASISKTEENSDTSTGAAHPTTHSNVPVIFPETSTEKLALKKKLIQEIESKEEKMTTPEYSLERSQSKDELVLKVQLPGVTTVTDCQLDISEDDVKLYIEGRYDLVVKLPSPIDEAEAQAKFNKKQSTLVLKMPLKGRT